MVAPIWGEATDSEDESEPEPPAYRFWNQRLKPLYDSCLLPVKSVPSASHHCAESEYTSTTFSGHGVEHVVCAPPTPPAGSAGLSQQLRPLVHPPPKEPARPKKPQPRKAAKADASSSPSSPHEEGCEDEEPLKKKAVPFKRKVPVEGYLRTYKIRMWPTQEQKHELRRTFAGARRAFNWSLEQVKDHGHAPNAIALRNSFRAQHEPFRSLLTGSRRGAINSSILADACKKVADAYTSNFAKREKDPSHSFEIKSRGKRNYTEVVKIEKDRASGHKTSTLLRFQPVPYANNEGRAECLALFGSNLKHVRGIRLQDKASVIARLLAEGAILKEDAKIQWDRRLDAYYFIYTFEAPKLPDPDPDFLNKRIVSLDSGVTPFNAVYSPTSGEFGEVAAGFRDKLEPRILKLDALQSKITKRYTYTRDPATGKITDKKLAEPPASANRTKRQWRRSTRALEKQLARERRRQHGWTQFVHYDTANFLLNKYDIIINPKLGVRRLSMRDGRKLRTKTARSMLTMSHYEFDRRLEWASTRYAGRHVNPGAGEPGTSRTCTNCGRWKADLSLGDKIFHCAHCGVSVDRDRAGGARNNFFAALGKAVGVGPDNTSI